MHPPPSTPVRPTLTVAVLLRRERIHGPMSRWQPTRWVLADVLPHDAHLDTHLDTNVGDEPRLLYQSEDEEHWLHPGLLVELFRDDVEGYYLNASTTAPCWFVLWRMEEQATVAPEPIARVQAVSLSYHDAGRWLDAQESVEQIKVPPQVLQWLQGFIDLHYVQEPKRRKRPESFRSLQDRFGNPASVSTYKHGGQGGGGGGDSGSGGNTGNTGNAGGRAHG